MSIEMEVPPKIIDKDPKLNSISFIIHFIIFIRFKKRHENERSEIKSGQTSKRSEWRWLYCDANVITLAYLSKRLPETA